MNASSPGWTLLAVALGGLISTATAVLLERRRARRELVARTRDDRREFCMGLIDLTSQIEDLIYDVERHRDRPSHERLTEAAAPLRALVMRAFVVTPLSVQRALLDVQGSLGVAAWSIEPQQSDIDELHHGNFLHARAALLDAIRDDLGSAEPTLGRLARLRVRWRDARAERKRMKEGICAM